MELFKKVSLLSALLLSVASTASAFVPRTNKLSNTCSAPAFGGLCMSAVAEPPTADTETAGKVIENIRLVTEEENGMDFGRIFFSLRFFRSRQLIFRCKTIFCVLEILP